MLTHAELSANSKVKPALPGPPPDDVKVVKDVHINPRTRRQLIEGFWKGQRSISGRVAYVQNESDRDRLRRDGKVMILIGDLSAQQIRVIVPLYQIRPG